ncbi:MAG TPA: hypothetical protein VFZ32_14460 [Micromonosporaceae bacterium]
MPIDDLRCGTGHRFEVIRSLRGSLPDCPTWGVVTRKLPVRVGFAAQGMVPPPPGVMPQTWRGTYPVPPGRARHHHDSRHWLSGQDG